MIANNQSPSTLPNLVKWATTKNKFFEAIDELVDGKRITCFLLPPISILPFPPSFIIIFSWYFHQKLQKIPYLLLEYQMILICDWWLYGQKVGKGEWVNEWPYMANQHLATKKAIKYSVDHFLALLNAQHKVPRKNVPCDKITRAEFCILIRARGWSRNKALCLKEYIHFHIITKIAWKFCREKIWRFGGTLV